MEIYSIGQKVWRAHIESKRELITCPVCVGKKVVTVIFGDGTQVEVACGYCDKTYAYNWDPSGVVWGETYEEPTVEWAIITGVDTRMRDGEVEITYWFGGTGGHPDTIGKTKEEAIEKAKARIEQYKKQREESREKDKLHSAKSYAYNAKAYLDRAAQARKDVEYYQRKAKIMQEKARPQKTEKE